MPTQREGPRGQVPAISRVLRSLLLAAGLLLPTAGAAETISGPARVVDGDTLVIGDVRVRLLGLDAPERGQTCARAGAPYDCGAASSRALEGLIGGRALACETFRRDRYGRALARCAAGSTDLNRALVEAGWAVINHRYPSRYRDAERAARAARRGLWAGVFQSPWVWRRP